MIGAPTAMAGATLWALRLSGKLKGAMPRTGPRGKRRVSPRRPVPPASVSSRWASPPLKRRASSAANRKTDTARPTSPRAHLMGLPFSAEISWAISSVRSVRRRTTWSRAAARTCAGVAANSSRTAYAAATASSTWASVGTATVPTVRPSQGLVTSKLSSPVAGRPASQKAWVEVMAVPALRGWCTTIAGRARAPFGPTVGRSGTDEACPPWSGAEARCAGLSQPDGLLRPRGRGRRLEGQPELHPDVRVVQ